MNQKAIYNEFNLAIFHTCLRILHNREDAEECMQDAFIKLFTTNNLAFVNQAACFGWLKKVAVRGAIDRLRSLDFRMTQNESSLDAPQVRSLSDQNLSEVSSKEMQLKSQVEQVKEALAQLPTGYRTILSLYLFDGFDFDEIAQITKLKASTVRSQYARGRQKIQELIPAELWTL